MKKITIVITYEDSDAQPSFGPDMKFLGGVIESVMFDDALAKLEEAEESIRETITEIDTNNYLIDLENNISQDIFNGMDLKALAEKYKLKVSNLENITKNYSNYDAKGKTFYEYFNYIIEKELGNYHSLHHVVMGGCQCIYASTNRCCWNFLWSNCSHNECCIGEKVCYTISCFRIYMVCDCDNYSF